MDIFVFNVDFIMDKTVCPFGTSFVDLMMWMKIVRQKIATSGDADW